MPPRGPAETGLGFRVSGIEKGIRPAAKLRPRATARADTRGGADLPAPLSEGTVAHKRSICIDLDGVLASYDGWKGVEEIGDPIEGAVVFTQKLAEEWRVVIFTTRSSISANPIPDNFGIPMDPAIRLAAWRYYLYQNLKKYLDLHGFAYDEIFQGEGKPLSFALFDDRVISCRPQDGDPENVFEQALKGLDELGGM